MDVVERTGLLAGAEVHLIGDAAAGKDVVGRTLVAPARLDVNDLLKAPGTRVVGGHCGDPSQGAGPDQQHSDGMGTDSVRVQHEAGLAIAALRSSTTPTRGEIFNTRYEGRRSTDWLISHRAS
jgi:hypothetical protein